VEGAEAMSIIFENDIPPLHARPDIDAVEMDIYCLAPVYGAPASAVNDEIDGQQYQLFRETCAMSRQSLVAGTREDLAGEKAKMAKRLIERLATVRQFSDYAVGMPKEFIYRESTGKIVRMPQSIYRQLLTD
jgi:hypothetical protein